MQKQIILYLIIFLVMLSGAEVIAQVSIKEDGTPIDSSAQLELQSQDKGFLVPRMTETDHAKKNPAERPFSRTVIKRVIDFMLLLFLSNGYRNRLLQ